MQQLTKYLHEIKDITNLYEDRLIIHNIEVARAFYYRNKLSNGEFIHSDAIQILPEVEMELVDASTSPINIPSDYRILKSKKAIPNILKVRENNCIFTVQNARVLVKPFDFVSREAAVYANSGRANNRSVVSFLFNGYLYIKIAEDNPRIAWIDTITIEGLFASAIEAIEFSDELAGRDIWFHEYPIDLQSWPYIKQLAIDGLTGVSRNIQKTGQGEV
jgi:hypothetical protein